MKTDKWRELDRNIRTSRWIDRKAVVVKDRQAQRKRETDRFIGTLTGIGISTGKQRQRE